MKYAYLIPNMAPPPCPSRPTHTAPSTCRASPACSTTSIHARGTASPGLPPLPPSAPPPLRPPSLSLLPNTRPHLDALHGLAPSSRRLTQIHVLELRHKHNNSHPSFVTCSISWWLFLNPLLNAQCFLRICALSITFARCIYIFRVDTVFSSKDDMHFY